MNAMIHLRAIWKRLIMVQGATVFIRKRIDLHTAAELEHIVISQAKAEHDLKSGGEWQCARQVTLTEHSISKAYLAPGGRFFLSLIRTAAVVYVDLDAPEVTWRELIPPCPSGLQDVTISFEHIIDAPTLTLHVAIAIERHLPTVYGVSRDEESTGEDSYTPSVQEVSIWRVNLQLDSQGIVCGLQANHLSQFRHSQKGVEPPRVDSIKLQGNHLVLAQGYNPLHICSVIQWAAADGLDVDIPRKVVSHESCHVCVP